MAYSEEHDEYFDREPPTMELRCKDCGCKYDAVKVTENVGAYGQKEIVSYPHDPICPECGSDNYECD